jgi:CheY-like chemotaxis protein
MSDHIRILVIDDHKDHADGLAELLNLNGFEATHTFSGRTGLELAAQLVVDAVLLDINLPDMSGYEVCRKLRGDIRTTDIAVIFHSGSSAPYEDDHLGDAFLTYPVEFSVLFNVIRGCIARRRSSVA